MIEEFVSKMCYLQNKNCLIEQIEHSIEQTIAVLISKESPSAYAATC